MESALEDPLPTILLASIADLPFSFYLINVIALLLLLIASGLVSGSEIAFFSLDPESLKKEENRNIDRILILISHPRQLLATILILNNLINVFIVTMSTYALWQMVGKEVGGGAIAILTTTITILITFFGEIVPKVFASHNSMQFAGFTCNGILFFNRLLRPVSWALLSVSNIIEKRIEKKGYNLSVQELQQALEITTEKESTVEEKDMLKGIVNFGILSVKQVMRSRMDLTAIDVQSNFHELMDQINKTRFSRLPVYRETIDKIEGILYIKDVLPYLNEEDNFQWQRLLREVLFVPESKKIDDLFRDFQSKHIHMAIVVDEYGGTEGMVTMEDIIEEIVGEINDEFDEEHDTEYKKIDSNTHSFEGKISLNDFCKILDVDPATFDAVKGESESLGGLLLEINQRLPNAGEKIKYNNFHFTVVAVDQKKIKRVRVYIDSQKEDIGGLYED